MTTFPTFNLTKDKLIMDSSDSNLKEFISLLTKHVSSNEIEINWENNMSNIMDIFNEDIINSTDVTLKLQYEKKLVDVIIEIILRSRLNKLKEIINGVNVEVLDITSAMIYTKKFIT